MGLERDLLSTVPIWIRFPSLDLKLWSNSIIRRLVSLVGTPSYMSRAAATGERILHARVFVEINAAEELIHNIKLQLEGGKDMNVVVTFEWVRPVCIQCRTFGHTGSQCPTKEVWMPKTKGSGDISKDSGAGLHGGCLAPEQNIGNGNADNSMEAALVYDIRSSGQSMKAGNTLRASISEKLDINEQSVLVQDMGSSGCSKTTGILKKADVGSFGKSAKTANTMRTGNSQKTGIIDQTFFVQDMGSPASSEKCAAVQVFKVGTIKSDKVRGVDFAIATYNVSGQLTFGTQLGSQRAVDISPLTQGEGPEASNAVLEHLTSNNTLRDYVSLIAESIGMGGKELPVSKQAGSEEVHPPIIEDNPACTQLLQNIDAQKEDKHDKKKKASTSSISLRRSMRFEDKGTSTYH